MALRPGADRCAAEFLPLLAANLHPPAMDDLPEVAAVGLPEGCSATGSIGPTMAARHIAAPDADCWAADCSADATEAEGV